VDKMTRPIANFFKLIIMMSTY